MSLLRLHIAPSWEGAGGEDRMDFPPHTSPCRERLVGLSTESNGNFLCPKLSYQGLKINFSSEFILGLSG